jgi:hypothetical protein
MKQREKVDCLASQYDYQKGLKIWLNRQPYLTELDYLESKVIPATQRQINELEGHVVRYSEEEKSDVKIGGKGPTVFTERSFWLAEEKRYLVWLQQRKAELERPGRSGVKAFSWTGSPAQLDALWQALKDAGYIDQGTTKEAFAAIFADKLMKGEPVQWTDSNRLLSYLFNQMNSGQKPLILSRDWQSTIEKNQIFKNRNSKFLKAGDLSTALSNINDVNTGLNPKGSDKIDEILKALRP